MANYETILVDREDGRRHRHVQPAAQENAMSPKLHYEMVELLSALKVRQGPSRFGHHRQRRQLLRAEKT